MQLDIGPWQKRYHIVWTDGRLPQGAKAKAKAMPLLWIEHSTSRMHMNAGHEVDFSLALSQVS